MVNQEEDALRGVQQLLGHLVLPELLYFVDLGNTLGDTTSLDIWTISSLFERSKCPLYLLTLHIWVDDEELSRAVHVKHPVYPHTLEPHRDHGG
jgi:hypothetical protein